MPDKRQLKAKKQKEIESMSENQKTLCLIEPCNWTMSRLIGQCSPHPPIINTPFFFQSTTFPPSSTNRSFSILVWTRHNVGRKTSHVFNFTRCLESDRDNYFPKPRQLLDFFPASSFYSCFLGRLISLLKQSFTFLAKWKCWRRIQVHIIYIYIYIYICMYNYLTKAH